MNFASVIRKLIAEKLDINPTKVILSGEISYKHSWHEDGGHSWWSGASEDYYTIYGFTANGLEVLPIRMSRAYSDNGQCLPEGESEPLSEFITRTGIMPHIIVVDHTGKQYGESGENFREVTVFTTASYTEYIEKVNWEDEARWKKWLNNA